MEWTFHTELCVDYLVATVVGDLDGKDYRDMRDMLREVLESSGVQKALLDIRQAVLHVTFMELYSMAASNPDVIPRGTKYAILYSEKTVSPAEVKFGEDVATNRGASLKVFSIKEEAERWLAQ